MLIVLSKQVSILRFNQYNLILGMSVIPISLPHPHPPPTRDAGSNEKALSTRLSLQKLNKCLLHGRAPWSCSLMHHVLDCEVEDLNLIFKSSPVYLWLRGDGKQKNEIESGSLVLSYDFHVTPYIDRVHLNITC